MVGLLDSPPPRRPVFVSCQMTSQMFVSKLYFEGPTRCCISIITNLTAEPFACKTYAMGKWEVCYSLRLNTTGQTAVFDELGGGICCI